MIANENKSLNRCFSILDLLSLISSYFIALEYKEFALTCRSIYNTYCKNPIVIYGIRQHSGNSPYPFIRNWLFNDFESQRLGLLNNKNHSCYMFCFRTDTHQIVRNFYHSREIDKPNMIRVGIFADKLQTLSLWSEYKYKYTQRLPLGVFPDTLTKLSLTINYDSLTFGLLPERLTHLSISLNNKNLPVGVFPEQLTYLDLRGGAFNQPLIFGQIPPNLTSLQFGDLFNQPLAVGILPNSLTRLAFERDWNQLLENGFLKSLNNLQTLKFGSCFQQQIISHTPESLERIILEGSYKFIEQFSDKATMTVNQNCWGSYLITIRESESGIEPLLKKQKRIA